VIKPYGSTTPFNVAEESVTFVAGFVMTTGGPVALNVVKVRSAPYAVPSALLATIRKWYVVNAVKLLMLALTFRNVFPV
jgi:hypothetical protein